MIGRSPRYSEGCCGSTSSLSMNSWIRDTISDGAEEDKNSWNISVNWEQISSLPFLIPVKPKHASALQYATAPIIYGPGPNGQGSSNPAVFLLNFAGPKCTLFHSFLTGASSVVFFE